MTMLAMAAKLRPAAQDNTLEGAGAEAIRHLSNYRKGLPAHLSA
jgi:hypothetical protein